MADRETYFQRAPHSKENPYAQISRVLLRDESISFECRGLLGYLLSMRDDFKITFKHIQNHIKAHTGRDSLRKIVKEAIAAGYIKREDVKAGNLNNGCTYFVSEEPIFKKCLRQTDFQEVGIQRAENTSLLEEYSSSSEEELKEREREREAPQAPPPPPPDPNQEFSFGEIRMPRKKMESLIEDYGIDVIKYVLDKINLYAQENPDMLKKCKCHASRIRRWLIEDGVKKLPKQKPKNKKFIHPHEEWLSKQDGVFSLIANGKLSFEKNYVLIVDLNEKIYYDLPSFQEVMLNHLRKLNDG